MAQVSKTIPKKGELLARGNHLGGADLKPKAKQQLLEGRERKFTFLLATRNNEEVIQIDGNPIKPLTTHHTTDTLGEAMKDARRSPSPKTKASIIHVGMLLVTREKPFEPSSWEIVGVNRDRPIGVAEVYLSKKIALVYKLDGIING